MAATFCPQCGAARIGSFRYCRSCGFDFDELPLESAAADSESSRPALALRARRQAARNARPLESSLAAEPGWGTAPSVSRDQPGWGASPVSPVEAGLGQLPPSPQPGWGPSPTLPVQAGWPPPLAGSQPAAPTAMPPELASYRTISLVAWVGSALCMGWLALIQFGFANTIFDNGSFTALAAWNLLTAVLVIYGAVRLSRSTKRDSFRQSAVWAVVIVVVQGFQIVQGATHIAYILSTVAAAGGGLFAFLVYQGMPRDPGRPAGP